MIEWRIKPQANCGAMMEPCIVPLTGDCWAFSCLLFGLPPIYLVEACCIGYYP